MTDTAIRPFRLAIPSPSIDDLHARLARVRWPDEAPDAPWAYGTSVGFMRDFTDYRARSFDWRKAEAGLNTLPQYVTSIDGIEVHFIHVMGKGGHFAALEQPRVLAGEIREFFRPLA